MQPSKQLKQIIQIKHDIVHPNWLEANQLAIYKCSREFKLGACEANPGNGQSVNLT